MTAAQGGYTGGGNRFAGLTTDDDVSDNDTAETLAGTISLHMANLSLQTAATIEASRTQVNASLQQMAATQAQLQQQQQHMMQQMVMMLFAPQQVAAPVQYNPMFQQQYDTRYAVPGTGGTIQIGRGQGGTRGGRSRRGRSGRSGGRMMPAPMPYIGGTQMIPYLPS
jgi:hypothetical protein